MPIIEHTRVDRVGTLHRVLQRGTPALVLTAYAAAVVLPGPGDAAQHAVLFRTRQAACTAPAAILALTLFTAGVSVDLGKLARVARRPAMFLVGVVANVLVPLLILSALSTAVARMRDFHEAQSIIAGLALVAAMPVGGTAAAWTAHHRGNTALGVGLLVGSIAVSPLTIPIGLSVGSTLTLGDYADDLGKLTAAGGGLPALATTLAPCLLGLTLRFTLRGRLDPALPVLRLITLVDIVLLAYVNGAGVLRRLLMAADLDFLLTVFAAAAVMCVGSFALGWLIARCARSSNADALALSYATGLDNASMGAVLGNAGLREHPLVLAPVLAVSLIQMLTASVFGRLINRRTQPPAALGGE
jgi:bile acid:Na+ symporter, BASS family